MSDELMGFRSLISGGHILNWANDPSLKCATGFFATSEGSRGSAAARAAASRVVARGRQSSSCLPTWNAKPNSAEFVLRRA
jgi:hypothetical protein